MIGMIRLKIFCVSGLLTLTTLVQAQRVSITMEATGFPNLRDSLAITFARDYVLGQNLKGDAYQMLPLLNNQPVIVMYDNVAAIARLSLFSRAWPNYFIAKAWIVEAGDSVYIHFINRGINQWKIEAIGRGAAKYQLAYNTQTYEDEIAALEYGVEAKEFTSAKALLQLQQLEKDYIHEIEKSRKSIPPLVYETWMADIQGKVGKTRLHLLSYQWTQEKQFEKSGAMNEIRSEIRKKILQEKTQEKATIKPIVWDFSRDLLQYKYERIKWKLLQQRNPNYRAWELTSSTDAFTFKDLFHELLRIQPKVERDYLLTYSLLNPYTLFNYFGDCHPNDFSECLREPKKVVSEPGLQNKINEMAKRLAPGAAVLELETLDVNEGIIKLSDFRGKKVLLDMWIEDCTGCFDFKKELVQKLLPAIKHRKDIVIWSVGKTAGFARWKKLLDTHSHQDFVSSWANNQGNNNPWAIEYQISFAPFIMLVDEEGNLITSTVRKMETLMELLGVKEQK
jgi:hypothetical protein